MHCHLTCESTLTVDVRRTHCRTGTTHTYVLNGTLLRDVLIDRRWVTVSASNPLEARAA